MSRAAVTTLAALDGVVAASGMAVGTADFAARRVLPVREQLGALLPWGGLRRGSTVAVRGSTLLLFALIAEATAAGSWAAVVGMTGLGVLAAAEAGVAVERLVLVPHPGRDPAAVVAALIDGVDLVVVADTPGLRSSEARNLSARARQRGSVLLPMDRAEGWPAPDLEVNCVEQTWRGPGTGEGRLRDCEATVQVTGRGAAARPKTARMLLVEEGDPLAGPVRQSGRSASDRLSIPEVG
ncbi:hypothetical protein [Actinoalloteichus hymeniacidonis]|uniref:Uncharacterized protein n=1 Tax=Actinoalloteichus hymeniacidonis TaxID=340345 RepID=A0AAC9HWE3_9PSEU|nr:hypothetical protein [Actinoalloteichus hymeniacidonis]AOS65690.1 hypothetical protein TL08_24560 [Actinoalloteichus hymeniacidonis]MBB5906220.1 hypothetical protein [Actinoalloteichus hymeniacidonis]